MAASKKGSGRKGSGQEDSGITNIFLVLLLFAVLMLLIVYFSNKKKEEEANNAITPTLQASAGSEDGKENGKHPEEGSTGAEAGQNGQNLQEGDQSGQNSGDSTNNTAGDNTAGNSENANNANGNNDSQGGDGQDATAPPAGKEPDDAAPASPEGEEGDGTPAGGQPLESTPTPLPGPTDEPVPDSLLTKGEADDILAGEIREKDYSYQLADEHMELDGKQYFRYQIFHQQQEEGYSVLVDKENGDLFHYDGSSRSAFQGVAHYAQDAVPEQGDGEGMTQEKAKQLLSGISPESLMLPAPLDECSLSLDSWQTVVAGDGCYCLDVFYKDALAGSIYFTEDGEKVYYLDEFGEFVRVQ